jgi:hypothetical protein
MAEGMAVSGRPGASGNVRLEPTVLPTRLYRLGKSTLGWHPVVVPARAAA